MFSKISESKRSSAVERHVEAVRVGGAIPSAWAISRLRSSVVERGAHNSEADSSILSAGTRLFRCRIMALRLAVNQVIVVRTHAPEPTIPISSNGRTPRSERGNCGSSPRIGSISRPRLRAGYLTLNQAIVVRVHGPGP